MEALERTFDSNDWITIVFLLSLFCLVFARAFFLSRFQNFIILPFNNKYIFLYNKKGRLVHGFHIALTLFGFMNFSLYLVLAGNVLFSQEFNPVASYLLWAGGILLVFFLAKIGLQLGGSAILEFKTLAASLVFRKNTYLNYSALVMFIANLLLGYVYQDSKPIVYISLFLILSVNAIGWFSILKIHQKLITTHFFYFILYLCALEIAPFLIIANLLND
jgi:hypothetical protein